MRGILLLSALLAAAPVAFPQAPPVKGHPRVDSGIYGFWLNDNAGTPVPLASFKGEVLLIVNTASECGFTPQYEGLEKLYETYKAQGFRVLAFPSNDFGEQEPGTNAEIRAFCTTRYRVTFPLFSKIVVKGPGMHPLYRFLTKESHPPGDVEWNFQKYLVDRSGAVVARYFSDVEPMGKELRAAIERELAKKAE